MYNLFNNILEDAVQKKASDVHFQTNKRPFFRVNGVLMTTEWPVVNDGFFEPLKLNAEKEKNISYQFYISDKLYNCRINFFHDSCGLALVARILPSTIPTINDLKLPQTFKDLLKKEHGLIVLSGPTGSGKSTTIAALINEINENYARRIITLEDPIEYIHTSKKSLISQREIGTDTKDFTTGLENILREDPDVILIGEMRDSASMQVALNAAESGHLVLTTLHAGKVIEAIERIPQYFSKSDTEHIYAQFANSFLAVVTQKLLLQKNKKSRIAAFEILTNTTAARSLIRNGQLHQLIGTNSFITMEDYISELNLQKLI